MGFVRFRRRSFGRLPAASVHEGRWKVAPDRRAAFHLRKILGMLVEVFRGIQYRIERVDEGTICHFASAALIERRIVAVELIVQCPIAVAGGRIYATTVNGSVDSFALVP